MSIPLLKKASVCFLLLVSFVPAQNKKIRVWLIGDSTCAKKKSKLFLKQAGVCLSLIF
jgi:hypothetical protein